MKNKCYLILFSLVFVFASYAQMKSKVVLENGSSFIGRIIFKDTTHVKLELSGGHVMVFNKSEISETIRISNLRPEKGLFFQLEPIFYSQNELRFLFHTKMGFDFNRYWSIGIGTGIERLLNTDVYPFYLEGKYHLFDNHITPFLSSQVGYIFPTTRSSNFDMNGYFASFSFNMICFTNEHFGLYLGTGVRYNQLHRKSNVNNSINLKYIDHQTRFEIKLGILLK